MSLSSKTPGPFEYGILVNLEEEIVRLCREKEEAGRGSKMLARYPEFRIVLITMKAGSRWEDHKTNSRIFVQVLRGHIHFHTPDGALELRAGQMLTLDPGIVHSVDSREESAFLLVLSASTNQ